MKKKVLAGVLFALAVCSVSACGKNKDNEETQASGSVILSEASQIASQTEDTAESSTLSEASQVEQSGVQDTAEEATTLQMPDTQTDDTANQTQDSQAQPVPESITLEEDMASVSYALLARMISAHDGEKTFDALENTNGNTFWQEMNYLVSAYGVNNKKIDFNENTKEYSMKKAQLRYYAAALYSDLGKAKKLPKIEENTTGALQKGSKWKFGMTDTSAYAISIQSCVKQEKGTSYELCLHLVDTATQTSLGQYTATIKKSPYRSSRSPFHYTIVELNKMTKMSMETVLAGERMDEKESASQAGTVSDTQGAQTQAEVTQTTNQAAGTGTQQFGQVLSMPGTSATTTTAPQTQQTTTTPQEQTTVPSTTPETTQPEEQTAGSTDIAGATITAEAAMEIAKKYYGTTAADGTGYTYTYEGATTYQNVPYYNFAVKNAETPVINVLVSGDGARIYKGTNTNNSWSMQ